MMFQFQDGINFHGGEFLFINRRHLLTTFRSFFACKQINIEWVDEVEDFDGDLIAEIDGDVVKYLLESQI